MGTQCVALGGIRVDLMAFDDAVSTIVDRAAGRGGPPLCVVSVNLDHIHHFGTGGRWNGTLEKLGHADFLNLVDGAPVKNAARRATGRQWPRLAGSDLIGPLLDSAEQLGLRVGFLGGSPATQKTLAAQLAVQRPGLTVVGWWGPERSVLSDPEASSELARDVAAHGVDMLVVGLGKPRQELWMARYGAMTGAPVLLAFGAVVDFLAGGIQRAPQWVAGNGLEWAWRLSLEPSRLARRYLVDGPPAYLAMRRSTSLAMPETPQAPPLPVTPAARAEPGAFEPDGTAADVAVLVVTYNNDDSVDSLIASLRGEAAELRIRVIVADNSPTESTLLRLANHPDVIAFSTGGNLGYAGGINAAAARAGKCTAVLVLNPDLEVRPGAVQTLLETLGSTGASAVVPLLEDDDGTIYHSLRREPTLARAMGDAVFGARFATRPAWSAEIDEDNESYQHAHRIDWATGAAVMVRSDMAETLRGWDEQYFLYSEETDYFRRIRDAGGFAWFEPAAVMGHSRGGSGASPDLVALMNVNRVRYAASHHGRGRAAAVRVVTALAETARFYLPSHRASAKALLGMRRWDSLPGPRPGPAGTTADGGFPAGTVIIPAHNEAAVIDRTLALLAPLAARGAVQLIVACNGCTDDTADRARAYSGVVVLDLPTPSKTGALNAADQAATGWPRVYLDADVELSPAALRAVFTHLSTPGMLAARPPFRYDSTGADPLVRAYYRARMRIPAMGEHLWGAGAYALSAAGHERFAEFPAVTGDDEFVDSLFAPHEKTIVDTDPVVIRTPRTARALHTTLRRVYRGNDELRASAENQHQGPGAAGLLRSIAGPLSAADALAYAGVALAARWRAKGQPEGWERDETSRTVPPEQ